MRRSGSGNFFPAREPGTRTKLGSFGYTKKEGGGVYSVEEPAHPTPKVRTIPG